MASTMFCGWEAAALPMREGRGPSQAHASVPFCYITLSCRILVVQGEPLSSSALCCCNKNPTASLFIKNRGLFPTNLEVGKCNIKVPASVRVFLLCPHVVESRRGWAAEPALS